MNYSYLKKQRKRKKMNKAKEELKALKKKDKEWADAIKSRDGNRCVVCSRAVRPNAHHIIPRENRILRHNIMNGITLCPNHHRFSRTFSAHKNPFAFIRWLRVNKPKQYRYIEETFIN